jgi:stage III sporulation protein AD
MDSIDIVKISAVCIIAALICVFFDGQSREYGLYVKITASVIVLGFVIVCIMPVKDSITEIFNKSGADSEYLKILFKAAGICYISQFAHDICRDSGANALASQAETAGKCALLIVALPLFKEITDIVILLAGN